MADGDGFEVHAQALMDYANVIRTQAGVLHSVNGVVSGLLVSSDAFGKLPESGQLHAQYEQHAESDTALTRTVGEALDVIAEALAEAAKAYGDTDAHHAGEMNSIATARTGG